MSAFVSATVLNKMLDLDAKSLCLAFLNVVIIFWPCHAIRGILVPRPGTELRPSAVKAQSSNHWTTREFPSLYFENFTDSERLMLNHVNTPGFLAPRGEEFNPGPETRLDRSELLCNKVLLKYKGDRESF